MTESQVDEQDKGRTVRTDCIKLRQKCVEDKSTRPIYSGVWDSTNWCNEDEIRSPWTIPLGAQGHDSEHEGSLLD